MRDLRRRSPGSALAAVLAVFVVGTGLLSSCGGGGEPLAGEPSPRPIVFDPDEPVWAYGSTIRAGHQTYDVGHKVVWGIERTPYGLYLELGRRRDGDGPSVDVFFDGKRQTPVPDVYGRIITTPSGEYAAWIDRFGPDGVGRVVVVATATGEQVYASSEGMGEPGEDLSVLYESTSPGVELLTDETLVWSTASGGRNHLVVDLASGSFRRYDFFSLPPMRPTTAEDDFWSPDGSFHVEVPHRGTVTLTRVGDGQPREVSPAYGHRWQAPAGWLGDHTFLVLSRDHQSAGYLLACDLGTAKCTKVARVQRPRTVVFPGVPWYY